MRMTRELYTKEVMKHFRKPHNYGRMKNPSAIGKVGNLVCGDVLWLYIKVEKNKKGKEIIKDIKFETFGCMPSDEKIVMNSGGWEDISSISKKDLVLNENGEDAVVIKNYRRRYKGILIKIVPFVSPFNSFSLTPEHPVLCIKRGSLKHARRSNLKSWLRIDEKELLSTKSKYVEAKDIEESDYLIFAYNNLIKDNKLFTKELMRLIGYYLAEGYICAKGNVVAFAFNKKERKEIEEVKFLIRMIIGKKAKERMRKNVTEVYVCSKKLADMLYSFAGSLAKNKVLAPEIMLLPPEKQWEMVCTYLAGDGNSYRRRSGNSLTYRIATASQSLAIQIQEILARIGIFSSIRETTRRSSFIEGRKIPPSKLYVISYKLKRKNKIVRKSGDYFLVPVRKIEKIPFDGFIFNLHVEPKNSFLVRGFVVHNCVAALATSSVITDLAKGKTIEEAMKINREDVVKSLGGLPPMKLHCSVLAADALSEAIYDYFSRYKRSIPEELKKRHERIEREKKEIERRYKDWVEMEERMHRMK